MAELVDARDSKSRSERSVGSIPTLGTKICLPRHSQKSKPRPRECAGFYFVKKRKKGRSCFFYGGLYLAARRSSRSAAFKSQAARHNYHLFT
jgi:hypothetical protein